MATIKVISLLLCIASFSSAKSLETRIIGGTPARAGEFPFSAAITIYADNGLYFCGGALISDQYVLTAAQCAHDALRFTIVLGSNRLTGSEPNKVTVAAEEYFLHPAYSPSTLQNDLAVIRLRLPIEFNDYIRPIALPTSELKTFDVAVATGWGQTSDQDAGTVDSLNRVTVTVISNDECRSIFGSQITDQMVCVDGNYNQGTCHGDSGSPLVQYTLGQQATHVGVASFFSGNGCESVDPSGFGRTFSYLDWIRNVTGIV